MIDAPDVLGGVGVVLLAVAVYIVLGWAGVLGFLGAACLVVALVWGRQQGTRGRGH